MSRSDTPAAVPVEPSVRPCPFCGSTNGADQMGETYRWRLWQCNECGAKGPDVRCQISGAGRGGEAEARQLALEAWNERDNSDVLAERERCAKIVDVPPGTEAWEVIGGEEGLTMLRELAAQIRGA